MANEGARALRKVNLERFKAKLRDETSTWRGRALTPARHWLRRWAPFRRLRRRTSAPRIPTRHGCNPWKCRRDRMISDRPWRGGYCTPWSWMTPRETSRRSMSPTSGCSERRRTHGTRRRCWRSWWHRARPGLGGGQAVLDPLGDEEAPGRAPDVWGDLEEARKR